MFWEASDHTQPVSARLLELHFYEQPDKSTALAPQLECIDLVCSVLGTCSACL